MTTSPDDPHPSDTCCPTFYRLGCSMTSSNRKMLAIPTRFSSNAFFPHATPTKTGSAGKPTADGPALSFVPGNWRTLQSPTSMNPALCRTSFVFRAGELANPAKPNEYESCLVPAGPKARFVIGYVKGY